MLVKSLLAGLASAQGFRDLEKKSVEVPRIGTDVIVSCEGTRIAAKVMKSYIERNSKWLGSGKDLSLDVDRYTDVRDCAGKADEEGNYILEVTDDFQKCGMQISPETEVIDGEVTVTGYKFKNHVYNQDGNVLDAADRALDLVEFECVYPNVQMTTGEMNPLVQSAVSRSKVKEIVGDMRLYLSSNYTDFYTSPPVLSLNDDLFIEVNLERPLISEAFAPYTEFSTVMENCWGTPSQSRDGALKYYIIKNQCPVEGDTSLEVSSNGEGLTSRFNLKMFKFIGDEYNDVWLHCTVRACNATADSCIPDCGDNRKRRSATRRELPFVSFGKELLPISQFSENSKKMTWTAGSLWSRVKPMALSSDLDRWLSTS
ncbi:Oidioi.mRNA.OKI2018_I69.XSR.g16819.t1.cds [Oikopleura dioica]|uniref:Oidioi.mRNA.OKI2018_I69.XSR.g16819.t1.cds n=1 Tax=Oikopleura dioica TaxID=34765 RepID=A0ABN7SL84_OIKDI|nr:Oidioi.mRNA.OKI2018_I69.XSR.g16819.t1.cds [Oikopleura dioica]